MELDNKTKTPQLVRASDKTPRGNSCTQGSRRSKKTWRKKTSKTLSYMVEDYLKRDKTRLRTNRTASRQKKMEKMG